MHIQGLDPHWQAFVSASSGRIYFQHSESGHTQWEVPAGFADIGSGDPEPSASWGDDTAVDGEGPTEPEGAQETADVMNES